MAIIMGLNVLGAERKERVKQVAIKITVIRSKFKIQNIDQCMIYDGLRVPRLSAVHAAPEKICKSYVYLIVNARDNAAWRRSEQTILGYAESYGTCLRFCRV